MTKYVGIFDNHTVHSECCAQQL